MLYVCGLRNKKVRLFDSETKEMRWEDKHKVFNLAENVGVISKSCYDTRIYKSGDVKIVLDAAPFPYDGFQTKMLFLNGYMYLVEKGMLTYLVFQKDAKFGNVKVRFSDFCKVVGNYSVNVDANIVGDITFVFDDSLKNVRPHAFYYMDMDGVTFDISEVTDTKLLHSIYAALEYKHTYAYFIRFFITDNQERFDLYTYETELLRTTLSMAMMKPHQDEHIMKYNKADFLRIIPDKAVLRLNTDKNALRDAYETLRCGDFLRHEVDSDKSVFIDCVEYFKLFGAKAKIYRVLRYVFYGGTDRDVLDKLSNFVKDCIDVAEGELNAVC